MASARAGPEQLPKYGELRIIRLPGGQTANSRHTCSHILFCANPLYRMDFTRGALSVSFDGQHTMLIGVGDAGCDDPCFGTQNK